MRDITSNSFGGFGESMEFRSLENPSKASLHGKSEMRDSSLLSELRRVGGDGVRNSILVERQRCLRHHKSRSRRASRAFELGRAPTTRPGEAAMGLADGSASTSPSTLR